MLASRRLALAKRLRPVLSHRSSSLAVGDVKGGKEGPISGLDTRLQSEVKTLGAMLGKAISKHSGDDVYHKVEVMRKLAREWRVENNEQSLQKLKAEIENLSAAEMPPIAASFTHFLSLANAAESHHRVRRLRELVIEEGGTAVPSREDTSLGTINALLEAGTSPEELYEALNSQTVELVFTAHPTEVNRRTLLHKHKQVSDSLEQLYMGGDKLIPFEKEQVAHNLFRAVESIWNSDEVRRTKPTPQDESRAGMAILEQILWDALPSWLRKLDSTCISKLGRPLPPDAAPIKFASWMGGDRDGNPNVTPECTQEVSFKARWQASTLLRRDVRELRMALSMTKCSAELRELVGKDIREPYREVLKNLELDLDSTISDITAMLRGKKPYSVDALKINRKEQVMSKLKIMHHSLVSVGHESNAEGPLKDLMRKLASFGLVMAPLDIRQESTRHSEALDAITRYLGIGSYLQWDELTRQTWLQKELQSRRPLLQHGKKQSQEAAEFFDDIVKDTLGAFDVAAGLGPESLGAYVISMAKAPSDVLAVKLLMKEAGLPWDMRVVPLFETLADLEASYDTMQTLFKLPWYSGHINGEQEVMIGYSDSAKDAGRLAAAWAQYEAQERLAALAKQENVKITFFHGKGGTVSRGGNPALYQAILAQPAGTVLGNFRVTEQGEMVTQNYGHSGIAERTLDIYTAGVLYDRFKQPAAPEPAWRDMMGQLSATSCDAYRGIVREDKRFVPYFRQATPELELGSLNIGSRPAKRRPTGGVETLRAIPWVFAWTQTRLNLPAWLGVGEALSKAAETDMPTLMEMYSQWPFFNTNIDLFEMTLAKADVRISEIYDQELVADAEAQALGAELRSKLKRTEESVLAICGNDELISKNSMLQWQLALRNPYVDPLNILQVSALRRLRAGKFASEREQQQLQDAMIISINGIAAGMRNTG
ncbi:unnamed protein product [Chrysoparadoxa australica]